MAEQLEESQAGKKKKKWKALLFGVGAFLMYKAFDLLKWLIKPLLKYFGLGELFSFDNLDLIIFMKGVLIVETVFLLLFIPLTRYYYGLLLLHLRLRNFHLMLIFVGWLSVVGLYIIDHFPEHVEWWQPIVAFIGWFAVTLIIYAFQVVFLHFYGRLWRLIAQKKRTINVR